MRCCDFDNGAITLTLVARWPVSRWVKPNISVIFSPAKIWLVNSTLTNSDINYSLTRQAWESDEAAVAWLAKQLDMTHRMIGKTVPIDEARLKRWMNNLDLAKAHMKRDELKSAKRFFNMALREAEQLSDGGDVFCSTAKMIAMFDESMDKTSEDLFRTHD